MGRERTMVKAAFADLIFGRAFSALGVAGGRAAVWGAAASGESEGALGMTVGGESVNGGCSGPKWRTAGMITLRIGLKNVGTAERVIYKRDIEIPYNLRWPLK